MNPTDIRPGQRFSLPNNARLIAYQDPDNCLVFRKVDGGKFLPYVSESGGKPCIALAFLHPASDVVSMTDFTFGDLQEVTT